MNKILRAKAAHQLHHAIDLVHPKASLGNRTINQKEVGSLTDHKYHDSPVDDKWVP